MIPNDRHEANKLVAMYLIAIGVAGNPNSHVWMQVDSQMSDLEAHMKIVIVLITSGLVKQSNHFLTLTERGLALHAKLVELYMPKVVENIKSKQSPC